jgi:hypothetical protein
MKILTGDWKQYEVTSITRANQEWAWLEGGDYPMMVSIDYFDMKIDSGQWEFIDES